MTSEANPFKAPEARVADVLPSEGNFIPEGRQVPAGNGIAWISRGWEMFREAPGTWIGLSLVFFIILMVLGVIPLVNFLSNILLPVFVGGIMMGCKAQEEGNDLKIGHLFAAFSDHAGKLLLVGVIYIAGMIAIMAVAGIIGAGIGFSAFMMGGSDVSSLGMGSILAMVLVMLVAMLFLVPLAMALWFAPPLVIFHEVAPFQAMKTSFFASLKNFVPFLVYGLVAMVLGILACIPLFLGLLVLMPVLQASIYAGYRDIFTEN